MGVLVQFERTPAENDTIVTKGSSGDEDEKAIDCAYLLYVKTILKLVALFQIGQATTFDSCVQDKDRSQDIGTNGRHHAVANFVFHEKVQRIRTRLL
jgi:hypothetical protein